MTAIELIKILEELPPDTPIYMACVNDDTGQGDYPLKKEHVSVQQLQNGMLGGPEGKCLAISYSSGFRGEATLN